MSFLKRKEKNLIPPVEDSNVNSTTSSFRASSFRSITPAYNQSDDALARETATPAAPSRYLRGDVKGDVYSRGERNLDADRNELFAGYNPERSAGSNRFRDATSRNDDDVPAGDNEDEDVEAIKQQTRFTKQESVNSTRNALRIAREAEETARNTLLRLGDQSEKLSNAERHLDIAKGHSNRAEDKTDELKQLNRSIFRPVITFNKDAKRRAQEMKLQDRWEQEREERELAVNDIRESQNRVGQAAAFGRSGDQRKMAESEDSILDSGTRGPGRFRSAESQAIRKEQRKRFQFEATASDDEVEDELDDNLNEISEATNKLKTLGLAMGQELDSQNDRLTRFDGKVGKLDNKIYNNTERLKRIR